MKSTTSPRGSGSVRRRLASRPRRPRRSTGESRLRSLGFTPKIAYAVRLWIATHTIERNFSAKQISYDGLCHPSSFSRAKDLLISEGLIVQLCEHKVPGKGTGEKGLDALYRFTEAAYQLVLRAPSRRAKCSTPGSFQNPSLSTSYPKAQHVPSLTAPAPVEPKKEASGEESSLEPSPVVKLLVEEGLWRGKAEALAKAFPPEVDLDLLPFLLEVTRDTVAKRGPREGKPEPLKVHLLKCLDPELLKAARSRQRSAGEWKRSTAGLAWESLAKPFRVHPGVSVALGHLVSASEAAKVVNPNAAGYLSAQDQVREARVEVLKLILAAAGESEVAHWESAARQRLMESTMVPESLVWKRARAVHIQAIAFRWAGLPETTL